MKIIKKGNEEALLCNVGKSIKIFSLQLFKNFDLSNMQPQKLGTTFELPLI